MMKAHHDRIAIVTGAGSGVGAATASALIADGWRVVYAGRRLDALQRAIAATGDPWDDIAERTLAVPTDVTQPESVA
ncbi:MAG: SDR family NAD(P)-dependent oxidoreductase, partial [Burkholderiaceae bacterium]|nr:SDR family NAD(P)-dependent oxidoreductase [Burkholderiaceae bacterium]